MKTSSCLLLRDVLSHPPFHWVSCSIWEAFVYGRRETEFSILPRGPLVDPVHALEAHLLPMHCSVTPLINHATGHVLFLDSALRLSYYVSVAGLNLAPVLPILAGLGTFYPKSPSRDLIILPHSSPGGHGDFQHSALPTRACHNSHKNLPGCWLGLRWICNQLGEMPSLPPCVFRFINSLHSQFLRLSFISQKCFSFQYRGLKHLLLDLSQGIWCY